MIQRFNDRREGGKALAAKLSGLIDRKDIVVLALPRGGVPVAFEVAKKLKAPLDVFLVRKLGVPGQEELAFGAIASGGTTVFNKPLVDVLHLPDALVEEVIEREKKELERREKLYRAERPALALAGKTVIVIDDGIATGASVKAAIAAIRAMKPARIIVAAPVASEEVCSEINRQPDKICVCAIKPEPLRGVGMWYRNFDQTPDAEVIELLRLAGEKEDISRAA